MRESNKKKSPLPLLESGILFSRDLWKGDRVNSPLQVSAQVSPSQGDYPEAPLKMAPPSPPTSLLYRPCFIFLCGLLLHCLLSSVGTTAIVHMDVRVCAFFTAVSPAPRTVPGTQ